MDWHGLYAGRVSKREVSQFIKDPEWQALRVSLKGKTLSHKYQKLKEYWEAHPNDRAAQVRVTNYVTALSRGGLIKPEDYR